MYNCWFICELVGSGGLSALHTSDLTVTQGLGLGSGCAGLCSSRSADCDFFRSYPPCHGPG